ncbi:MAG TPA: GIY-YIG nuclease family protein [Candidatus Paceibacterota bacterium]
MWHKQNTRSGRTPRSPIDARWDVVGRGSISEYNVVMFYVYIIKNKKNEKYTGCTINLKRRLHEHNTNQTISTKNNGDYRIVWYCAFIDKGKAFVFEKYLKSSSGGAFSRKHLYS